MTTIKTGEMRRRIVAFCKRTGLDAVCRRRNRGYSLYWDGDGQPLARLKETGQGDEVEILCWNDELNRWEPVNEFGAELPLDEALEYLDEDPDDVFFEDSWDNPDDVSDSEAAPDVLSHGIAQIHGRILNAVMIGAACGGLFQGAYLGLGCGAVGCFLFAFYDVIP